MASLPEHWESDYDGSRWFFRYKPTGIIQYTFPKPGDEFPEFIDAAAPPLDLPPEEKLVSQQQVKRRGTSDSTSVKSPTGKHGDEVTSATLAKGEGGFWFQPDFMYLGPGSYNDISPVDEQDEEQAGLGLGGKKGSDADGSQAGRSRISPNTSTGTTPLTSSSQPATATPVLDSVTETAVELPTRRAAVGVVAELPSETTARCRDETHPAPVELPGHRTAEQNDGPVSYSSAFDIAPSELPAEHQGAAGDARSRTTLPDVSEKRSGPPASGNSWQSQRNPTAQAVLQAHRPASVPAESSGEKYQPYNPVRYVPPQDDSRRISQPVVPPPNTGPRYGETIPLNAQYTVPEQGPSDAPSFLRPPRPPPKMPLDGGPERSQPPPPFQGSVAATRVPSVLQPARGRPNLPLQTSVTSIASSSKQYEPYSPYRELQDDIDRTVKLLASGMGEGTEAASHPGPSLQHSTSQRQKPSPAESRGPSIARTNTLPLHMPSLPFMGGAPSPAQTPSNPRPSPPSAPSAGVDTSTRVAEAAARGETDLSDYKKYAPAAPAEGADVPKPLNLARNSVVYPAYSPPSQPVSTQRGESGDNQHAQHAATRYSFSTDPGTRPQSTFSVVSDFSTISEVTTQTPPQPTGPWQTNMPDASRQRPPAAHSHSYASSVSTHRLSVSSLEAPREQTGYQNPVTPPPEAHPQRPPLGSSYASAPSVYRGTAFGAPPVGVHRNPSTQSQASVTSTSSRQSQGPGVQRPSSRLSSSSHGEHPDVPPMDQSFSRPSPPQQRPHSVAYGQLPVHDIAHSQTLPPNAALGGRQQPPGHHLSAPDSSRPNDYQYRQLHNQSTPVPDAQPSAPRKSSTGQRPVTFAGQPMYFNVEQPGAPSTQHQQTLDYQAGQASAPGPGHGMHSMAGPPPSETWPNQKTGPPIHPTSSHQTTMSFQSWMGPQPGASVSHAHQMLPHRASSQTTQPVQPAQIQPGPRPQSTPAHQNLPSGGYSHPGPPVVGLQAQPAGVRGSSPSPGKERNRLVKHPKNDGGGPPHGNHSAPQNSGGGRAKLQKGGGSMGSIPQQIPPFSTTQQRHSASSSQQLSQVPMNINQSTRPEHQRVASVPPANLTQQSQNTRPVSYMAPQPNPALRPVQTSTVQKPLPNQQPPRPTSFSQHTEQLQSPPPQRPHSGLDVQRPGNRQQEPTSTPKQQWVPQQQPPGVAQNHSVTHAHTPSLGARPAATQHQQPVQQMPQNRPPQGYNLQPAAQSHTSPRREPPSLPGPQQTRGTETQTPSLGLYGEGAQSDSGGQSQHGPPQYGQTPPVALNTSQPRPPPKRPVANPVELPSSPIPVELSSVPTASSSQQQHRPQITAEPPQPEPPQREPPRQEPPRQEPLRPEPPRQQAPRQETLWQEPPQNEPAALRPKQEAFGIRNMANEKQTGGNRPSDEQTQRRNQAPFDRQPPPEMRKQAPPPTQIQPASRSPVQQTPVQPPVHPVITPSQAPVQPPKQQPVAPSLAISGGKPPNQPTQDITRFPVEKNSTVPASKPEQPTPVKAESPVPEPTPSAPGKAAEKATGGWGDTSGYDGSGWGDDDDFY